MTCSASSVCPPIWNRRNIERPTSTNSPFSNSPSGMSSLQSVGLPKGDKVRTAVMCDTLKRLLEPVIEGFREDDLIWPQASENKPRMKALFYATWRRIRKEAGLPEDMSPHDCRLTHINWIEKLCAEVSPTTLKEHVGHSADGVTGVNYTRPLTPAQEVLRRAIERLVN